MAIKKKSPIANKIRYDSNFDRTRENMAEFSRGGKAGKLIRGAFRELLIHASDSMVTSRLTGKCMDMLAGDKVSGRGERTVGKGELEPLRNFNFNDGMSFNNSLSARPTQVYDRATGLLTVTVPEFEPEVMVEAPRTTTHFVILAAAIAIDFDNDRYDHALQQTAKLDLGAPTIPGFNMALQLPANSTLPVILAMSAAFYQQRGGKYYLHKSGNFNAATVIAVFKP
jgi:hypothetical protein